MSPIAKSALPRLRIALIAAVCWSVMHAERVATAANGRLELTVRDADSGQPIPCRVHLQDARGNSRKPPRAPFWHDHFVIDGEVTLRLPLGPYVFTIERGPEYISRTGNFLINRFADDAHVVELKRIVDMSKQGWYAADLDVRRGPHELKQVMQAEDLKVAHLAAWNNGKNAWAKRTPPEENLLSFAGPRFVQPFAARRSSPENAIAIWGQSSAISSNELNALGRGDPWTLGQQSDNAWLNVEHAASLDLPLWLALGKVDSITLAGAYLHRDGAKRPSGTGRRPDRLAYPGPLGEARFCQSIYQHVLNCGFRIPPSAGSGSGQSPNPVGYNRAYVYLEDDFTYENWWSAFRAGRVVITNGPLLRPLVEGRPPGHVFRSSTGEDLQLQPAVQLATREKIHYLQIIKDGKTVYEARLEDYLGKGRLPAVEFTESGWFLVRAVTDNAKTYRFASSGPFYVEIGERRPVSKASAEFFLRWLEERVETLNGQNLKQWPEQRTYYEQALRYWKDLVSNASRP